MSKYIEVNDLSRVKFHPLPYTHITPADIKDAEAYELGWNDAIDAIIENAPTIDAVEVVRCEDCEHRNGDYCHRFHDGYSAFIHRDDFCKDGERRQDNDEQT